MATNLSQNAIDSSDGANQHKISPRKFSEKIALLRQAEDESNAEFEKIINATKQITAAPKATTSKDNNFSQNDKSTLFLQQQQKHPAHDNQIGTIPSTTTQQQQEVTQNIVSERQQQFQAADMRTISMATASSQDDSTYSIRISNGDSLENDYDREQIESMYQLIKNVGDEQDELERLQKQQQQQQQQQNMELATSEQALSESEGERAILIYDNRQQQQQQQQQPDSSANPVEGAQQAAGSIGTLRDNMIDDSDNNTNSHINNNFEPQPTISRPHQAQSRNDCDAAASSISNQEISFHETQFSMPFANQFCLQQQLTSSNSQLPLNSNGYNYTNFNAINNSNNFSAPASHRTRVTSFDSVTGRLSYGNPELTSNFQNDEFYGAQNETSTQDFGLISRTAATTPSDPSFYMPSRLANDDQYEEDQQPIATEGQQQHQQVWCYDNNTTPGELATAQPIDNDNNVINLIISNQQQQQFNHIHRHAQPSRQKSCSDSVLNNSISKLEASNHNNLQAANNSYFNLANSQTSASSCNFYRRHHRGTNDRSFNLLQLHQMATTRPHEDSELDVDANRVPIQLPGIEILDSSSANREQIPAALSSENMTTTHVDESSLPNIANLTFASKVKSNSNEQPMTNNNGDNEDTKSNIYYDYDHHHHQQQQQVLQQATTPDPTAFNQLSSSFNGSNSNYLVSDHSACCSTTTSTSAEASPSECVDMEIGQQQQMVPITQGESLMLAPSDPIYFNSQLHRRNTSKQYHHSSSHNCLTFLETGFAGDQSYSINSNENQMHRHPNQYQHLNQHQMQQQFRQQQPINRSRSHNSIDHVKSFMLISNEDDQQQLQQQQQQQSSYLPFSNNNQLIYGRQQQFEDLEQDGVKRVVANRRAAA